MFGVIEAPAVVKLFILKELRLDAPLAEDHELAQPPIVTADKLEQLLARSWGRRQAVKRHRAAPAVTLAAHSTIHSSIGSPS